MKSLKSLVRWATKWAWIDARCPSKDENILKFLDNYCLGFKVGTEQGLFKAYYPCDNNNIREAVLDAMEDEQHFQKQAPSDQI